MIDMTSTIATVRFWCNIALLLIFLTVNVVLLSAGAWHTPLRETILFPNLAMIVGYVIPSICWSAWKRWRRITLTSGPARPDAPASTDPNPS